MMPFSLFTRRGGAALASWAALAAASWAAFSTAAARFNCRTMSRIRLTAFWEVMPP